MTVLFGILVTLVIAGVFYLLFRVRFGREVVHGLHMTGQLPPEPSGPDVDPVCGMRVEQGSNFETEHAGRRYRFCSISCLRTFEADPRRFVGTGRSTREVRG